MMQPCNNSNGKVEMSLNRKLIRENVTEPQNFCSPKTKNHDSTIQLINELAAKLPYKLQLIHKEYDIQNNTIFPN